MSETHEDKLRNEIVRDVGLLYNATSNMDNIQKTAVLDAYLENIAFHFD